MKVIGVLQGVAAMRVAMEEFAPDSTPPIQDVVNRVQQRYQFLSFPILQQQQPGVPLVFLSGRFIEVENAESFGQLTMLHNGDIIVAKDTELAEKILDDLLNFFESEFKYKFHRSNTKRSFNSTVVIEFETDIEDGISEISSIEQIINTDGNSDAVRKIKRLSFGTVDPEPVFPYPTIGNVTSPLELIERADFVIERRSGQPVSSKRYFCTAPMQTQAHIHSLQQIEGVIKGSSRKRRTRY
jgi:hypothetical protein